MPLTGRNNLAETPLLQDPGDWRWRQLERRSSVCQAATSSTNRVSGPHATFFYVEVAFPPERPMAAFGEND